MSTPDIQRCQPAEYKYYAEERVWEDNLSVGSYVLMFMLRSDPVAKFFKCPSLVATIDPAYDDSGLHTVRYKLLDTNLMPAISKRDSLDDGYMRMSMGDIDSESYFIDNDPASGYDYGDEAEKELQEMVASQSLSRAGGQVWPIH